LSKKAKWDESKLSLDRDERGKFRGVAWLLVEDQDTIIELLWLHYKVIITHIFNTFRYLLAIK